MTTLQCRYLSIGKLLIRFTEERHADKVVLGCHGAFANPNRRVFNRMKSLVRSVEQESCQRIKWGPDNDPRSVCALVVAKWAFQGFVQVSPEGQKGCGVDDHHVDTFGIIGVVAPLVLRVCTARELFEIRATKVVKDCFAHRAGVRHECAEQKSNGISNIFLLVKRKPENFTDVASLVLSDNRNAIFNEGLYSPCQNILVLYSVSLVQDGDEYGGKEGGDWVVLDLGQLVDKVSTAPEQDERRRQVAVIVHIDVKKPNIEVIFGPPMNIAETVIVVESSHDGEKREEEKKKEEEEVSFLFHFFTQHQNPKW